MSEKYEPKKGDRVRVVLEGEVRSTVLAGQAFTFGVDGDVNYVTVAAKHVVSVENLPDPLPTTPGSVIRHTHLGHLRMLTEAGWIRATGGSLKRAEHLLPDSVVLFDAGKVGES